ncbi:meiotic recombination protein W68 isoform X2 [Cephus cinctus]|uniref:DNA topoisomerase (ATP-hydrolyzing) n=1 Tax=Cephus cinctus TaxID=211228 RepID=A0AAJ7W3Y0_CEPCN|nr:meiotic recombination protein W68 isoform X2 [Cephus cinctus]
MNKKEVTVVPEDREDSRKIVMTRAENVVLSMLHQIAQGRCPEVIYPTGVTETLDQSERCKEKATQSQEIDEFRDTMTNDSKMTRVDFTCKRSRNKLTLMTTVLSHAHRLSINGDVITRRSLYYDLQSESTQGLAPEQRHVDNSVNHVASLLGCAPWDLGFIATGKGLVAGDLTLGIGSEESVDCNVRGGVVVPQIFSNLTKLQTSSDFVLIIEKDSVFQKLIEQDCPRSLNCILITGKGYPDVSTRMLVRILWEKLNLPVYCLVDADPYGIEIMLVYRLVIYLNLVLPLWPRNINYWFALVFVGWVFIPQSWLHWE